MSPYLPLLTVVVLAIWLLVRDRLARRAAEEQAAIDAALALANSAAARANLDGFNRLGRNANL